MDTPVIVRRLFENNFQREPPTTPKLFLRSSPRHTAAFTTPGSAVTTSSTPHVKSASPVIRYGVPTDPPEPPQGAVRYHIPDDDGTDDDGDDSQQPGPKSPGLAYLASPVEEMLQQLQLQWEGAVQVTCTARANKLHHALSSADKDLSSELARITEDVRQRERQLALADEQLISQQIKEREQRLQELQRSHEQAAALQLQQVERLQKQAKAEAERRAAEERAAAEARARKEAEEKAQKEREAEAERAKQAAESKAKADAAAAEAAAKAGSSPPATAAAAGAPGAQGTPAGSNAKGAAGKDGKLAAAQSCLRAVPEAVKFEEAVGRRFEELQALIKPLFDNDSLKKQRRDIEKKMTVHVQQVSATQDQIARKCGDVYQLIAAQPDPAWRTFAMLQFATKVIKQHELIMLNNKAAFPLATVLVKVSTLLPELMELTVGLLHKECILTVPLAFVLKDEGSGAELTPGQYRRLMRYKELEDPDKPGSHVYESDDAYMSRMEGLMILYGAIVQDEDGGNPHGAEHGWRWLSRLLNALPATRLVAKALIFFLRSGGYGLHRRFRGQFIKLLKCMYEEVLPELGKSKEADVQAVRTLLDHYLTNGQYNVEPEGRSMPKVDMSSYQRA